MKYGKISAGSPRDTVNSDIPVPWGRGDNHKHIRAFPLTVSPWLSPTMIPPYSWFSPRWNFWESYLSKSWDLSLCNHCCQQLLLHLWHYFLTEPHNVTIGHVLIKVRVEYLRMAVSLRELKALLALVCAGKGIKLSPIWLQYWPMCTGSPSSAIWRHQSWSSSSCS